jgi:hypothetical protein
MLLKVLLDALGFVDLDGAGVRFFLGDTDLDQNVENGFALYLEFPGQVIDSNLVQHYAPFPPLCFPSGLRLHSILTVRLMFARAFG